MEAPPAQGPLLTPQRALILLVLAAGFAAFFVFDLGGYLTLAALRENREALIAAVAAAPVETVLAFALVYIAVVAFSVPAGTVLTLAAGFLFGIVFGAGIVVVSATAGATLVFLAAKTALGEPLRARMGERMRRLERGFAENAFGYLLFLRLVPVFPFFLVNLAPAFLGVRLPTFAAATFLGIIPGTLVYASVGNGLGAVLDAGAQPDAGILLQPEILLPLLGLAILAILPAIVRKFRRRPAEE